MTGQRLAQLAAAAVAAVTIVAAARGERIRTEWAEDVSPKKVLPDYPRPQMVREDWRSLNGPWDYAIRPADQPQPAEFDGKILVPFCAESQLSGVGKSVGKANALWYRRTFDAGRRKGGERVLLHFEAVDWHAVVTVNGKPAGEHKGGYTPFTFDVTDLLTPKGDQELVVRAWDPTDDGFQPRGKQVKRPGGIMYTAVTGIWQPVWLETVPAAHVTALEIVPDVDAKAVRVTVRASAAGAVAIKVRDGRRVVASATGQAGEAVTVAIPDPKLWSPPSPFLYGLDVAFGDDAVASYFGMRKIEVRKDEQGINRLCLNGAPLFQIGPLDQGWWPDGLYTAPTDEALRFDVEITKAMGFNMTRKHVKVEPARWYYWCDQLGLLVWQDMPSGSNAGPDGQANYRRELKEMIDAFRHFPSIVMWVPFNEGWGQHDTEDVVAWIKGYDPTRLVNNASGWTDKGVGDVNDIHSYPGPNMPKVEPNRAVVLGEFGGLGLVVTNHLWQQDKNWGYRSFKDAAELEQNYARLIERLRPLIGRGLCAAVYTQITDVEVEVNGLLTYDRKVRKIAPKRLAELHARLLLPPPIVRTLVPSAEGGGKVLWRYTTQKPADGWMAPDFDDSAWKEGAGGFGTATTPGAIVGTEWKTEDIWIRRTFELAGGAAGRVQLSIHHDEDAEVFLNGKPAASLAGYTQDYVTAEFDPKLLATGRNTLAIHCRQTRGGQYIDAGLVEVREAPAP